MTKVKMPEKDLFDGTTVSPSGKYKASINGYSEAQLKQYGDDRARETLEMAATVCDKANGPEYPADLAIKIRSLK